MQKMKIQLAASAMAMALFATATHAVTSTYTFDYPTITASASPGTPIAPNSTVGTLGQDNFYHIFGAAGTVRNDPMPGFSGNWLGSLLITPDNAPASDGIEARVNNATFSYSLGSTRTATFSADVLVGAGNTTNATPPVTTYRRSIVSPGVDLNGDGGLRLSGTNAQSAETAFQFGYESASPGRGWYVRGAAFGTNNPGTNNAVDITGTWTTQLVVDFTANNGDGFGTLFIKQLFDGAGNPVNDQFHPASAALTNVNLQLKRMNDVALGGTPTAADPSTWNGFFARVNGNGGVDNISFTPTTGSLWLTSAGSWLTATNWSGGVPNAVDASAELSFGATATSTVFADADVTVGKLTLNNTNSYNVTGTGTMTLQTSAGSALVDVVAGSHKLNVPLNVASNTTINVAAGSTLRVSDPVTVQAGKSLTQTGSGTMSYESTVTVLGGGAIMFGGPQTISALSLGAGATASLGGQLSVVTINTLGLASGAHVDIGVNELRLSGTASEARAAIQNGEFMTTAADDRHGLGYGEMGDGKVRVLFTLNGDANLDHTIDFADLAIVAANYQQASGATYTAGDFTYDGVVGFADLVALAKNYDAAINGGLLPAGASEQFASDWHLAQSIAPEPTTLMLLGLPLAIAARRRG